MHYLVHARMHKRHQLPYVCGVNPVSSTIMDSTVTSRGGNAELPDYDQLSDLIAYISVNTESSLVLYMQTIL